MEDAFTVAKYDNYNKRRIAESWSPQQEGILQMWAEKASGWAWLHDKASRYYSFSSNLLIYPTLVISTIAGGIGLVVAGTTSCENHKIRYVEYMVAGSHILCSTLTSLNKYLRSNEKAEIHLHMNKVFSSFARKIVLELTLNPEDRRDALEFCKLCRDEYDKYVTDSIIIPDNVIAQFKKRFQGAKYKPEICNGLIHFTNYEKYEKRKSTARELEIKIDKIPDIFESGSNTNSCGTADSNSNKNKRTSLDIVPIIPIQLSIEKRKELIEKRRDTIC